MDSLNRAGQTLDYVIYALAMAAFVVAFFVAARDISLGRGPAGGERVFPPLRRSLPPLLLLFLAAAAATLFEPGGTVPGHEATFWRALQCATAGLILGSVAGWLNLKLVGEGQWSAWMLCEKHLAYRRAWKVPLVKLWLLYGVADRAPEGDAREG